MTYFKCNFMRLSFQIQIKIKNLATNLLNQRGGGGERNEGRYKGDRRRESTEKREGTGEERRGATRKMRGRRKERGGGRKRRQEGRK